ncbi:MAG: hypothetical protein KDD44_08900, partial [Bdellovibrionales bacterium]|nr:hypothetical protein [Bdellovibrionales bacterium]
MSIINKDRTLRRLNEDEVFISKVEKLFLLGGLCFFCLAWILSKYFQWIEPNGVLAAVGFSALNFRYWRVAVGVMLKGYWQTDFLGRQFQIPGRIIAIPLVSIKVLLLALFVVFVAS